MERQLQLSYPYNMISALGNDLNMVIEKDSPKYVQLKNYIKSIIENGDLGPGDRLYSENELAQRFNISRHTVRQAVGELVNENWLSRIQGSGTFVNQTIGTKKEKSGIIGVVTTYLDDYIFPGIIKGIDSILSQEGYSIILGHTNNNLEREAVCLQNMLEKNVDGFIIEPTKSALPNPNYQYYEEMKKKNCPCIFINGYYPSHEGSFIIEDDEMGGYLATRHLFELGHERLAGIFKVDDIQGHGRYSGFVRAHREEGRVIPEDTITWYTTEDTQTLFTQEGSGAMLSKIKKCTGLICYNDQITLKVIDLLRAEGLKVPDDISLISFDDSDLSNSGETRITTLAHPKDKLGERAAEALLEIITGKHKTVREKIKPELIIRNSAKSVLKK